MIQAFNQTIINLNAAPFVAAAGATENGVPVPAPPGNSILYCSEAEACEVAKQMKQAAALQGFEITVNIVDGILSGSYGGFTKDAAGNSIYIMQVTLSDVQGNSAQGSDIAGQLIARLINPFAPGHVNQGDKDYKVVDPIVNGQYDTAHATDVQVPAFGVFVDQSSGLPVVPGQPINDTVRLVWDAVPVAPVAPVAPTPGTPGVL